MAPRDNPKKTVRNLTLTHFINRISHQSSALGYRPANSLLVFVLLLILANRVVAQQSDPPSTLLTLQNWLQAHELDDDALKLLGDQHFASVALTGQEADSARELIWSARRAFLQKSRQAEWENRELVEGELRMPFWFKVFGDAPPGGRSLFISMHGGGGAPATVNDSQFENQKRLYQPEEGIYLVPRAPTNTWDLWHQSHIDRFFDRLITDMMVFENVNPNRVYLMGYSAGGDGVYQLAPRMADRFAAAAMMAGHPNESRPDGLRNIGFTLHMGANDAAYNRNRIASEWEQKLKVLKSSDPEGYVHEVTIHEGLGHWMNLQDAVAVPWMAKFDRQPWPNKIVWVQDDVRHDRFYWLQTAEDQAKAGDEVIASVQDNTIHVERSTLPLLTFLLRDTLLNIDHPITVVQPNGSQSTQSVSRTIANLADSLTERNDPASMSPSRLTIELK